MNIIVQQLWILIESLLSTFLHSDVLPLRGFSLSHSLFLVLHGLTLHQQLILLPVSVQLVCKELVVVNLEC